MTRAESRFMQLTTHQRCKEGSARYPRDIKQGTWELGGAVTAMTWIFGLERLLGNQYTIKIRKCQVGEAGGVRKEEECGTWKGPLSLRVSGNAWGKWRGDRSHRHFVGSLTARQGPFFTL